MSSIFGCFCLDIQKYLLSFLDQVDLVHLLRTDKASHQYSFFNKKLEELRNHVSARADFYQVITNSSSCEFHQNGKLIKYLPNYDTLEEILEAISDFGKEGDIFKIQMKEETFYAQYPYGLKGKLQTEDFLPYEQFTIISEKKRNFFYWTFPDFKPYAYYFGSFEWEEIRDFSFHLNITPHEHGMKFIWRTFQPEFGIHFKYYFRTLVRRGKLNLYIADEMKESEDIKKVIHDYFQTANRVFFWRIRNLNGAFSIIISIPPPHNFVD